MDEISRVMQEIETELRAAINMFGPFVSAHEGAAVIKEEYDEFWDEVKSNKVPGAFRRMRNEAKQTAAMSARFMLDIRPDNQGKEI